MATVTPKNFNQEQRLSTGCYMQLLGVGNTDDGTVPSVLLFFDHKRYVFNVGEGFQRFTLEYRILSKIGSKMEAILLTQLGPQTLGGLPGLILSMDSQKLVPNLLKSKDSGTALIGPKNVEVFLENMGVFSKAGAEQFRAQAIEQTNVGCVEDPNEECVTVVQDHLITIKGITLCVDEDNGSVSESNSDSDKQYRNGDGSEAQPKRRKTLLRVNDGQRVRKVNDKSTVICYICELQDLPGKFLPQKAASLGVPKGKLFGELQRGNSVKSLSGKTVTPEQVMEPPFPGPIALVIDCPTLGHLQPLLTNATLKELQELSSCVEEDTKNSQKRVHVIFHLGPSQVVQTDEYVGWMKGFGEQTAHVVGSQCPDTSNNLKGSSRIQMKLNVVDEGMFPVMKSTQSQPQNGVVPINFENLIQYTLSPVRKSGFDRSLVQEDLDCEEIQKEAAEQLPELSELIRKFQQEKQQITDNQENVPDAIKSIGEKEMEIVFLGTGAALPSKYRNTTGILLNFFEKGTMLVDCGEYSYMQLKRKFGEKGCKDIVKRLRAVWISHIHADHHAGLYSIIDNYSLLHKQKAKPLLIFGPRPLSHILYSYTKVCQHVNFRFIRNVNLLGEIVSPDFKWAQKPEEISDRINKAINSIKQQFDLEVFESFPTLHCRYSYGLVLKSKQGWKLVFSGDSRPCEALQKAARNATVLIQEATFENDLQAEAEEKYHCTNKEALDIASNGQVYRTILTHFSQRYTKVPLFHELMDHDNMCIAFDLMTVNLKDVPWMPKVMPVLKELFKKESVESLAADTEMQTTSKEILK